MRTIGPFRGQERLDSGFKLVKRMAKSHAGCELQQIGQRDEAESGKTRREKSAWRQMDR